jgi:murein DD-endopeptidase MepM/ murein hydrolase activator NlpD
VNRFSDTTRRAFGVAIAMTALAGFVLAGGSSAPASDLHAQLHRAQAKLSEKKKREGVLSTTIARDNRRLRELTGQVATLRNQIAIARNQLERVEAELARDRIHLRVLRGRLRRSLRVLSDRLVAIYKSDQPDALTVILNAHGFDDMLTRYDYLRRISQQDADLVGQVRHLRDAARDTVRRVAAERDRIAARKAELARQQRELAARQVELAQARTRQQAALAQVRQSEQDLEGDISDIQSQIAAQIAAAQAAEAAAPAPVQPAGPVPGGVSASGLAWPVNGPVVSPFGPRTINGGYENHPGIDIAVPTGTPIHAAAAGTVLFTQSEATSGGYGNYTCIDHGGGLSTCYAHQRSFAVSQGQHVSQGEVIGYSDCTGYCFGPHLHFEVRIDGQVQDPLNYLP